MKSISDSPSHPFYIKTVQGTGTDNNNVNNNATSGVNWTPSAAGTYYISIFTSLAMV